MPCLLGVGDTRDIAGLKYQNLTYYSRRDNFTLKCHMVKTKGKSKLHRTNFLIGHFCFIQLLNNKSNNFKNNTPIFRAVNESSGLNYICTISILYLSYFFEKSKIEDSQ